MHLLLRNERFRVNVRNCMLAPESRPSALGQFRSLVAGLRFAPEITTIHLPPGVITRLPFAPGPNGSAASSPMTCSVEPVNRQLPINSFCIPPSTNRYLIKRRSTP
jgi:hypothetical protein